MTAASFDPYRALETLHRHGVRFVVIGAFAAVAQGYPLNTRDLDVTPDRDRSNTQRLVPALVELRAELRVPAGSAPFPIEVEMLMNGDAWTLSTIAGPLDLVYVPAGTRGYSDLVRDARRVELRGTPILLASIADVIRMKEASGRPKDEVQLPALRDTLEILRERERVER